jgi:hypothetical protein
MYTITWFDGCSNQRSICAPNATTAWEIYWALKETIKRTTPTMDAWLSITGDGYWYNPEPGVPLRPCESGYRVILKEGVR